MDLDWGYFRQVYEDLHELDDPAGRQRYLAGHQATAAAHLAELAPLRKREPIPAGGYTGEDEQLWRITKLYALNWVGDYLIELFCPEGDPPPGFGVTGGRAVHTRFFTSIGLGPFEHAAAFSPFHHEIFTVVQDPAATCVPLEEVLWPGFWFGDLLFSRAGATSRPPAVCCSPAGEPGARQRVQPVTPQPDTQGHRGEVDHSVEDRR